MHFCGYADTAHGARSSVVIMHYILFVIMLYLCNVDLYCEIHSRKISLYELNLTGVELVSRRAMTYS